MIKMPLAIILLLIIILVIIVANIKIVPQAHSYIIERKKQLKQRITTQKNTLFRTQRSIWTMLNTTI